ncbi:hypothetical protein VTI28DRAFT_3910 [Corynascus sepedonium]
MSVIVRYSRGQGRSEPRPSDDPGQPGRGWISAVWFAWRLLSQARRKVWGILCCKKQQRGYLVEGRHWQISDTAVAFGSIILGTWHLKEVQQGVAKMKLQENGP